MSIGADVLHALPELRAQAVTLMRNTATIERAGATLTLDVDTGVASRVTTDVYVGPCRLRPLATGESTRVFGDEEFSATRMIVEVPHDVFGIRSGDVITLSDIDDTDAAGRRYRVVAVPAGTDTVLKSIGCEVLE